MNYETGDLIQKAYDGEVEVLVQGCNCRRVMGAGFARLIYDNFEEAYEADLEWPLDYKDRLGHFSVVRVFRGNVNFLIVNAYTQLDYGKGVQVDYDAIRKAFKSIARKYKHRKIHFPKIGAGLGGGDWSIISNIIDEELNGLEYTCVDFKPRTKSGRIKRRRGMSRKVW